MVVFRVVTLWSVLRSDIAEEHYCCDLQVDYLDEMTPSVQQFWLWSLLGLPRVPGWL